MNRSVFAAFLLLSLVALPAFGGGINPDIVVNVTTDGADPSPDNSICENGLGGCTLRAAIQTANARAGADRVVLGQGIYLLTIKRDLELADEQTGDLDVTSDITVVGQGDTLPCKEGVGCTAIDGKKGKDRIFDVTEDGDLSLSNLIVRNGSAKKGDFNPTQIEEISGGCILVEGTLALDDVTVTGCKSPDDGGCIGVTLASATIQDTFLDRCKTKDAGGGIEVDSGSIELNRVTIANSKASDEGGGIETSGGELDLRNVTFSRNKAKQGGALATEDDGSVTVNNATFFDNKASEGAGIFSDPDTQDDPVNVSNSLLRTPKENNCLGAVASLDGNLENGTDCPFVQANDCSDCFPAILDDLEDNGGAIPTHGLEDFSEAINNGVNGTCEATDARLALRSGVCDSGAFEFGGIVP